MPTLTDKAIDAIDDGGARVFVDAFPQELRTLTRLGGQCGRRLSGWTAP